MKTLVIILIILFSGNIAKSEEKKYLSNSLSYTKSEEVVLNGTSTTFVINDKQIKISPFRNVNNEGILTIEEIKEKDYNNSLGLWYYCKSETHSPYIVIVPKVENPSKIDVFKFEDEVTIIHRKYFVKEYKEGFGRIIPLKRD